MFKLLLLLLLLQNYYYRWLLKSSRQHKSFYFSGADFKRQAKLRCLFDLACDCVLERFLTKKSIRLEKLANSRYVFEIQPTGTGSIIISILHE